MVTRGLQELSSWLSRTRPGACSLRAELSLCEQRRPVTSEHAVASP